MRRCRRSGVNRSGLPTTWSASPSASRTSRTCRKISPRPSIACRERYIPRRGLPPDHANTACDTVVRLPSEAKLSQRVNAVGDPGADATPSRHCALGAGERVRAEAIAVTHQTAARHQEWIDRAAARVRRRDQEIEGEVPGHEQIAIESRSAHVDQLGTDADPRREVNAPAGAED